MVTTAPAPPASRDAVAARPLSPARAVMPTPAQLASLGAVLCVYREQSGGALGGWAQAQRAEVASAVDSDGLHGEIRFVDRHGQCCWRLMLLPDGDFLAWERLCASLPSRAEATAMPVAERLWRRLAGRLLGGGWRAAVLRLHALPIAPGFAHAPLLLAASLARLSPTGLAAARRFLDAEGVPFDGLAAASAADDCCCERAMRVAARSRAAAREDSYTLIRLKGTQA